MGKMLGARVPDGLNEAIREAAKANGQSVNEYINGLLSEGMKNAPQLQKAQVKVDLLEIAQKVMHLRETKAKLEEMDESFLGLFGDPNIQRLVESIDHEIRQLVESLPEEEEEGIFSFLNFDMG